MTRASYLPVALAVCLLAGCNKSSPETGAAPAQDSTMTGGQMAKDSAGAMMDSSGTMMDSTMADSSKMMSDSTSMPMDTTMQMPADSTKQ
ncbi:MAG TPA: hypothetical protein VHR43_14450 [Gemmatimonadales bacterium]|jgi:hypothetical protein|nr:hypothetical protein [Gemmatimonadales bacterium]